jgi:hypothetical protein
MPPRYLGPPIVVPPPREREGTFGNGGYWGTSDNIPTTMTLAQMYEASQRHPRYLGPPVQDPGGGTSIPNPNVNVHPVLPPGMGAQVQGPGNGPPGLDLRTGKWDLQGAPQTSYSSQGWTGARPRRSPMLRTF